jgi:hypothetical protein
MVQPNQRLQLALPPVGDRPLAVLRGALIMDGEIVLTSFVRMTPALRRGAAETHNRYAAARQFQLSERWMNAQHHDSRAGTGQRNP